MGFTNKVHSAVNFIKIKWMKKEDSIHFWEIDWEKTENNVFSARLVKIANDSYEFEWTQRSTVKMLFVDAGENYQLDIALNSVSRGIINTILWYIDAKKKLWATNWKLDLEISLYMNKDNFKSVGLYINGERGNWRFSWEEQKAMITSIEKKNGTKENDYFDYDEKLKSCVQEIQDYISITDFQEEVKIEKQDFSKDWEISIEDLPF